MFNQEKQVIAESKKILLKNRLVSIDALRGATIAGMIFVINPGSGKSVYEPFRHASWDGCTLADLVFPFFLFLVGVSITLSLSKSIEQSTPYSTLYLKIIKRTLILFGLGLFLNAFPLFNIEGIRIMGVLQRIAVCYFITSVIFMHTNYKTQAAIVAILLFGYWALMEWVPVPGLGAGHFEKGENFAAFFDRIFLAGHMGYYEKMGEPEGFISTLPSVATTLFGVLTGYFLKQEKSPSKKSVILFIAGIIAIIAGVIWGIWLPINKHLWTSSYSVLTAGLALTILSIFYYLTDVKSYTRWVKPLIVFGSNAIVVYVLSILATKLIDFIKITAQNGTQSSLKSWLYTNIFESLLGSYNGSFAYALVYCLVWLGIMWYFYNKKIFIRI